MQSLNLQRFAPCPCCGLKINAANNHFPVCKYATGEKVLMVQGQAQDRAYNWEAGNAPKCAGDFVAASRALAKWESRVQSRMLAKDAIVAEQQAVGVAVDRREEAVEAGEEDPGVVVHWDGVNEARGVAMEAEALAEVTASEPELTDAEQRALAVRVMAERPKQATRAERAARVARVQEQGAAIRRRIAERRCDSAEAEAVAAELLLAANQSPEVKRQAKECRKKAAAAWKELQEVG